MILDEKIVLGFYRNLPEKLAKIRAVLQRPLTLAEKILYSHLAPEMALKDFRRGSDYVLFNPDRVAMQDATAQMALLQLENCGRNQVAVPSTVHCDHLIQASKSASEDLAEANISNKEVYDFLRTVSVKYGIGFWSPGAGIIHQIIFEQYAFPGGLMVGTDSHTPNAGGLCMAAIGVGGADAVDVMTGMPWELKMPTIIGVRLTGKLKDWTSPKDVILKLAGILTVKGGTDAIIEYFGPGTESISATGKGTICNMGAEVGATTSIFPYDYRSAKYLKATGRENLAEIATTLSDHLHADKEVLEQPSLYYDRVIEIDLSLLEPQINGPFTPDAANNLSTFASVVAGKNYPSIVEAGLIGSCTNSSYEDLSRAAYVIKAAMDQGLRINAPLIINPGSEMIRQTAERDGLLDIFRKAGAVIMANACGPCIGQWKRKTDEPSKPNSIVTSFNRNFSGRNDGNPNTHAFVCSPEIVAAFSIAGDLKFNPEKDFLINEKGNSIKLSPPKGYEIPTKGYSSEGTGFIPPGSDNKVTEIVINPTSNRLQKLESFPAWDGRDPERLALLIKVRGKCTTDHISMAGPWLKYRGHLDNISNNLLMGAINAFNQKANAVLDPSCNSYRTVSEYARLLKSAGKKSIVVAEENYGEGSSREHAAMEPRYLGVYAILAKSFARIHETNLKKQGMLALTFANREDYEKIREDDILSIQGIKAFTPGVPLAIQINHSDGTIEQIMVNHSYNDIQIKWFKAGSALNAMKIK